MDAPCNGWPNRVTWQMSAFLSTYKYSFVLAVVHREWERHRRNGRRSREVQRAVALRLRAAVEQNIAAIKQTGDLEDEAIERRSEVDWLRIADSWLFVLHGYKRQADAQAS